MYENNLYSLTAAPPVTMSLLLFSFSPRIPRNTIMTQKQKRQRQSLQYILVLSDIQQTKLLWSTTSKRHYKLPKEKLPQIKILEMLACIFLRVSSIVIRDIQ